MDDKWMISMVETCANLTSQYHSAPIELISPFGDHLTMFKQFSYLHNSATSSLYNVYKVGPPSYKLAYTPH